MMYFDPLRFESKVIVSETGCYGWSASKNACGYPTFGVKENGKFRCALGHRVAWQIAYGEIPDGLCVLHRCDTPSCTRPDHLFLGTMGDNMRDMAAKGRHVGMRGRRHPYDYAGNKITRQIAEEIRATIGSRRAIAELYGVSPSMVSRIKLGQCWSPDAPRRGNPHGTGAL